MDHTGIGRALIRAESLLDKALYYTSAALLIVIATAVFYTVVMRYLFSAAPLWAEEAPRVFFIWMTYLAIAVATRRGQNIRVTFFIEKLAPAPRLALEFFMHIAVMVMLVVLFWNVWPIISLNLKGTMYSTGWNNAWAWFPLPISCALMGFYQLRLILVSVQTYRRTGAFDADDALPPGVDL